MILYVWSRRNPHERLRLYGLFTVGAGYLSYILLGISVALGGSVLVDLVGIFVGHLYFYLEDIIPNVFNVRILKTPSIIYSLFPNERVENDDDEEDAEEFRIVN